MKSAVIAPALVILATIAVSIHVFCQDTCLKELATGPEHIVIPKPTPPPEDGLGAKAAPADASTSSEPTAPSAPEIMAMEKEFADLEHEIERGEYVRQINDANVAPDTKAELRARIRRFARLAVQLSEERIKLLDQSAL